MNIIYINKYILLYKYIKINKNNLYYCITILNIEQELRDNPCDYKPCYNSGICSQSSGSRGFSCKCTSNYAGYRCKG